MAWFRSVLLLIALALTAALPGADATAGAMTTAPSVAPAATAASISAGDTAWMLVSAALVLFMTIPGLALFYGGLVRTKNVLTIFTQSFAVTCLVTLLWVVYGYSLAFTGGEADRGHAFIGTFSKCCLIGVTPDSIAPQAPSIPEPVFVLFQMTFAIITPALLIGAFAERMKFAAVLAISALWLTIVYIPVCHMAWAGPAALMGGRWGLQDLAGGTVVEVNSGIAGLVCCLIVGRRKGFPHQAMLPHNSAMCITGACMLWVGWFGFNAGSAGAASGLAARAALTTQIAAAAAGCTWMAIEWLILRKPGALGVVTGAVAGLVAITPACGTVGPLGAIAIGVAAGAVSFWVVTRVKKYFAYDDSLDVFGVHGVGGMVGLVLTGVFAPIAIGGAGIPSGQTWAGQIIVQAACMGLTMAVSAIGTAVIVLAVKWTIGLRASETDEQNGLDYVQHGEVAYNEDR
jgi:Amt family ammonium transporter